MVRGRTLDASCSSSDKWQTESAPMSEIAGASRPVKQARPMFPQSELSWNSVKAVEDRGPNTQRTMITAKNPRT